MSALTALARVQAAATGYARPVATVRHLHVSERPLVLIALTLAGEANAPLAAMAGDRPEAPHVLVVGNPRNRDERFEFAARLAEIVLRHIDSRTLSWETMRSGVDGESLRRFADAPQILVPNQASLGFVRLLGRSTRYRRATGEHAVAPSVPVLGRWLTFVAERAELPGSSMLVAATKAIALHWASGQSAIEDENLATLMGWIDPPPGLTGRDAAAVAEDPVSWPPAGPATDPTFDNEVLEPLIAACSRPGTSVRDREIAIARLEDALTGQMAPTWKLMWRATDLLRALPQARSAGSRWERDRTEFTRYWEYLRDDGTPQPRRDSAVAAARRLNTLERAQASFAAQCAFDDPLVLAEYRLTGEAFGGTVTAAEPGRVDASGPRRKLRPLITVRTEDPFTAEPGTKLVSPARPRQDAVVVSVCGPEVVLELVSGMGRSLTPATGSVPSVGERITYTSLTDEFQRTGAFPERDATPWTHGGPPRNLFQLMKTSPRHGHDHRQARRTGSCRHPRRSGQARRPGWARGRRAERRRRGLPARGR